MAFREMSREIPKAALITNLCNRAIADPSFEPSSLALALAVKDGIPGSFIQELQGNISGQLIKDVLGIKRSLKHLTKKSLSIPQSEAIFGLCRVWSILMFRYDQRNDLVENWLNNPKMPLRSRPITLLQSAAGREAVLDVIERMDTGDFS